MTGNRERCRATRMLQQNTRSRYRSNLGREHIDEGLAVCESDNTKRIYNTFVSSTVPQQVFESRLELWRPATCSAVRATVELKIDIAATWKKDGRTSAKSGRVPSGKLVVSSRKRSYHNGCHAGKTDFSVEPLGSPPKSTRHAKVRVTSILTMSDQRTPDSNPQKVRRTPRVTSLLHSTKKCWYPKNLPHP